MVFVAQTRDPNLHGLCHQLKRALSGRTRPRTPRGRGDEEVRQNIDPGASFEPPMDIDRPTFMGEFSAHIQYSVFSRIIDAVSEVSQLKTWWDVLRAPNARWVNEQDIAALGLLL
jgi:hypothetical protein